VKVIVSIQKHGLLLCLTRSRMCAAAALGMDRIGSSIARSAKMLLDLLMYYVVPIFVCAKFTVCQGFVTKPILITSPISTVAAVSDNDRKMM
jgi:hypothetical protein